MRKKFGEQILVKKKIIMNKNFVNFFNETKKNLKKKCVKKILVWSSDWFSDWSSDSSLGRNSSMNSDNVVLLPPKTAPFLHFFTKKQFFAAITKNNHTK